jgi:hypothetical protein
MAITAIIVTVLVTVTSVALDTWNRSRSELRAARNAKTMVDFMARDFESLVIRKGNSYEWLSAVADSDIASIGGNMKSTNASKLIFFTSAKDRYDGQIGTSSDKGGDVSCVGYQLNYRDPITKITNSTTPDPALQTFVFNRLLVNPDSTFKELLGKTDLTAAFLNYPTPELAYSKQLSEPNLYDPKNFVCENVYQFSITFLVNVTTAAASGTNPATTVNVPVIIGPKKGALTTMSFKVNGVGIVAEIDEEADPKGPVNNVQLAAGRITGVSFSTTVISDFGIEQIKKRSFTDAQKADFIAKNSYQYTKLVPLSPP